MSKHARISKKKRRHMTHHVMAHLHGKTSVAPLAQVHHVHKASAGAARLGARVVTNHATAHHGRRTVQSAQHRLNGLAQSIKDERQIMHARQGHVQHLINLHEQRSQAFKTTMQGFDARHKAASADTFPRSRKIL